MQERYHTTLYREASICEYNSIGRFHPTFTIIAKKYTCIHVKYTSYDHLQKLLIPSEGYTHFPV